MDYCFIVINNATDYEMSFSNINPRYLPAIIILDLSGYERELISLEEETFLGVDGQEMIVNLLQQLLVEKDALLNLDYQCMDLIERYCMRTQHEEFEAAYRYMRYLGMRLHTEIKTHRMYVNGKLPYRFYKLRSDGVYLQREDIFRKQLQEELREQYALRSSKLF